METKFYSFYCENINQHVEIEYSFIEHRDSRTPLGGIDKKSFSLQIVISQRIAGLLILTGGMIGLNVFIQIHLNKICSEP